MRIIRVQGFGCRGLGFRGCRVRVNGLGPKPSELRVLRIRDEGLGILRFWRFGCNCLHNSKSELPISNGKSNGSWVGHRVQIRIKGIL